MEAALRIEPAPDSLSALVLAGDLTAATAPVLAEPLQALGRKDVSEIQLDLTDVRGIDATGLAILVSAARSFGAEGGTVLLCGLAPHLMRIFEVTGLVRYFEFA